MIPVNDEPFILMCSRSVKNVLTQEEHNFLNAHLDEWKLGLTKLVNHVNEQFARNSLNRDILDIQDESIDEKSWRFAAKKFQVKCFEKIQEVNILLRERGRQRQEAQKKRNEELVGLKIELQKKELKRMHLEDVCARIDETNILIKQLLEKMK